MFAATVSGDKQVLKRLERLRGSEQRKYIRQGARAAASLQIKAAKQLVPDRKTRDEKGKLKGLKRSFQNIPSSKWKNAAALRAKGIIGARVGFKKKHGAHAHLVEFGHWIVTRHGKNTGKRARPHPFMRPAMDANRSRFRRAFQTKIQEGIKKNTR